MRKMLTIVLTIAMSAGIVSAQDISGNYQLESLEVHYVMVTRDINQMGSDGAYHTTDFDNALSSYGLNIGWPFAGLESHIDYQLPASFSPGDTISELQVSLPSAAWLAGAGIAMNTDFTDGAYTINAGSTYPTTQTIDCITTQVIPGVSDIGIWTDGGFGPLVDEENHTSKTGWGIITSAVFASFEAPDMVNQVYGTDYGVGTTMEDWGYIQTNYNDDWSQPTGLNIGWEAHDGPNAGIGVVSETDQYYNADEAALGLVNNVVGLGAAPGDSVTIASMAFLGSMQTPPITINVPTGNSNSLGVTDENPPYMLGGPGQMDAEGAAVIDPTTGAPVGLFSTSWGYIFDPTGDLLGGGDHIPFSGDEALQFTGYYVTWNGLQTIEAIAIGAAAGIEAAPAAFLAFPSTPVMTTIADYLVEEVMWQWDVADAVQEALNGTASAALQAQFLAWELTAATVGQNAATLAALEATFPWVLGLLTQYQAQLVDSEGNAIIIDDSDHDLDPDDYEEWTDDDGDYIGETYPNGGRLFVELYPNCIPARWSQYIDSQWNYTGALAAVDDGIVAEKFELKGNYPNPFNPTTKIRFSNDRTANVKVHVYSLKGERVATILNSQLNSGTYDVSWNGMNSSGRVVPSGMYLYEVRSEERSMQGKMLFLK